MFLVVDSCIRGDDSATRKYYQAYLELAGEQNVEIVELDNLGLIPLDQETLQKRDALSRKKDFQNNMFRLARQFREADSILVAAPFWDLSFPSILKVYMEHVTVNGLTFGYDAEGRCLGYCKAEKLFYFSTCGGYFGERHLGFEYMEALAAMLGIPKCIPYIIEGLDIDPTQRESILNQAIQGLQIGTKTKG